MAHWRHRGVRSEEWHIAGANLLAAWGNAEWTQLGGWFWGRDWAPWRQTPPRSWGGRKAHSHLLLFGFTLLSYPSLSRGGGCLSRTCHPHRCQLQLLSQSVFLFCFCCFLSFSFWHVLPRSLCVYMLCPSQWQGQPIAPDGPTTIPPPPTAPYAFIMFQWAVLWDSANSVRFRSIQNKKCLNLMNTRKDVRLCPEMPLYSRYSYEN